RSILHRLPPVRVGRHPRGRRQAPGRAPDTIGRSPSGIAGFRSDLGNSLGRRWRVPARDSVSVQGHSPDDLRAIHQLLHPDSFGRLRRTMFYSIRHLTRFRYASPVSESVMETRMHPRSDGSQRCLTFHLSVSPRCRAFSYRDHLGNNVHHFDIPGQHSQLVIIAEALIALQHPTPVPASLAPDAWAELDALVMNGDYWEMLLPSEFANPTPSLVELARQLNVCRRDD